MKGSHTMIVSTLVCPHVVLGIISIQLKDLSKLSVKKCRLLGSAGNMTRQKSYRACLNTIMDNDSLYHCLKPCIRLWITLLLINHLHNFPLQMNQIPRLDMQAAAVMLVAWPAIARVMQSNNLPIMLVVVIHLLSKRGAPRPMQQGQTEAGGAKKVLQGVQGYGVTMAIPVSSSIPCVSNMWGPLTVDQRHNLCIPAVNFFRSQLLIW